MGLATWMNRWVRARSSSTFGLDGQDAQRPDAQTANALNLENPSLLALPGPMRRVSESARDRSLP